MESKTVFTFLLPLLIIALVRAAPMPRDGTVLEEIDVSRTESGGLKQEGISEVPKISPTERDATDLQVIAVSETKTVDSESSIPDPSELPLDLYHGRVPCPHEEATEDPGCQNHCLPKGYTYGICVSNTCTCL